MDLKEAQWERDDAREWARRLQGERDYAQADVVHWVGLSVKREHERDKARLELAGYSAEAMRCIFQLGVVIAQTASERDRLKKEREDA